MTPAVDPRPARTSHARRFRLRALGVGVLALVGAILVAPKPLASPSATSALGRSLGGSRVVLVDMLFLRAGALVRDGRLEEAASLYRTVLELDPDNVAAVAYLADVLADGFLGRATTPEDQFAWWRSSWELIERGMDLAPDSALLHTMLAYRLWRDPISFPDLKPHIERAFPDRTARAVYELAQAARLSANIPYRGRVHIRLACVLGIVEAIEAEQRGDRPGADKALGIVREIGALRARALSEMTTPVMRGGEEVGMVLLRDTVRLGIAAVLGIRERLEEGDIPAAKAMVAALADDLGEDALVEAARLWVAAAG